MGKKKEKIGKGLRALISNIDGDEVTVETKQKAEKELSKATAEIKITKIEANPFQPRTEFNETELKELSDSIKTHGVIQPITVRAIGGDKYQIISGERRWRASKKAGLKSIPAYVRVTDDQGLLEMAIVENIQRADLNSMEIAISFQRLIDECDISHEEMASRVNKNRSTITNYLRLLKLPPQIQKSLKDDEISMGHARALIGVTPREAQMDIYRRVMKSGLSVRATEELIKSYKAGPSKVAKKAGRPSALDIEIKKIKTRLSDHFEAKVEIKRNAKGKGSYVIYFDSDDQFNEILDLLED